MASFKAPTSEDLDHDYLWRCVKALQERGRIGIFNRIYYEETLVVRVRPEFLSRAETVHRMRHKGHLGRALSGYPQLRALPRAGSRARTKSGEGNAPCCQISASGKSRFSEPAISWLRAYDRAWLRGGLVAGLSRGRGVVPQAMAYADIARLPLAVGLYTALVPLVVYALIGISRPLSVTTTSMIAILTAGALQELVPGAKADLLVSAAL